MDMKLILLKNKRVNSDPKKEISILINQYRAFNKIDL